MNHKSPVWHPFTQHALSGPAVEIERGEGSYLHTKDGRKIINRRRAKGRKRLAVRA